MLHSLNCPESSITWSLQYKQFNGLQSKVIASRNVRYLLGKGRKIDVQFSYRIIHTNVQNYLSHYATSPYITPILLEHWSRYAVLFRCVRDAMNRTFGRVLVMDYQSMTKTWLSPMKERGCGRGCFVGEFVAFYYVDWVDGASLRIYATVVYSRLARSLSHFRPSAGVWRG